jgi:hypothetical protein
MPENAGKCHKMPENAGELPEDAGRCQKMPENVRKMIKSITSPILLQKIKIKVNQNP